MVRIVVSEVHIFESDLDLLYKHAERSLPLESAALLFGIVHDTVMSVSRVVCVSNDAQSVTRFAVDPETQYHLLIEAEEKGEELIGIFHSHPAPTYPSETDLRYMKLNPVPWLIASKTRGSWELAAFVLKNDHPVEIQVFTV
jgi:proteasome lid subunit RPN8/RPN11